MIRQTKQRQLIKDCIVGYPKHLTAKQVFDLVNQNDQSISLATVYRNLNALVDQHEISCFTSCNNEVVYDGTLTNHDHFICTSCGKIIDIEPLDEQTIDAYQSKYGVKIDAKQVVLSGLCHDCLQKEGN